MTAADADAAAGGMVLGPPRWERAASIRKLPAAAAAGAAAVTAAATTAAAGGPAFDPPRRERTQCTRKPSTAATAAVAAVTAAVTAADTAAAPDTAAATAAAAAAAAVPELALGFEIMKWVCSLAPCEIGLKSFISIGPP